MPSYSQHIHHIEIHIKLIEHITKHIIYLLIYNIMLSTCNEIYIHIYIYILSFYLKMEFLSSRFKYTGRTCSIAPARDRQDHCTVAFKHYHLYIYTIYITLHIHDYCCLSSKPKRLGCRRILVLLLSGTSGSSVRTSSDSPIS